MDFQVRKAVSSDAEAFADIHMRSWVAAYKGIVPDEAMKKINEGRPAMWRKTLSYKNNHYAVLQSGRVIGLMGIEASRDEDVLDAGEIGAIYLHPDFFGQGYGQKAMDFAVGELRSRGYDTIILWVLEDNVAARRFYEKCGFSFDGTKKEIIIGKPLIAVRYRLELE